MPTNIEIKAVVRDFDKINKLAKELSKSSGTILNQHDVFYNTIQGRLKYRKIKVSLTIVRYLSSPISVVASNQNNKNKL